ncbi:MAG TPA: hypothetical protein DDY91_00110 [Planctomycetaceae bacterium]|nr:hypothetical protein [Planctomycetaceae bacterium]
MLSECAVAGAVCRSLWFEKSEFGGLSVRQFPKNGNFWGNRLADPVIHPVAVLPVEGIPTPLRLPRLPPERYRPQTLTLSAILLRDRSGGTDEMYRCEL